MEATEFLNKRVKHGHSQELFLRQGKAVDISFPRIVSMLTKTNISL